MQNVTFEPWQYRELAAGRCAADYRRQIDERGFGVVDSVVALREVDSLRRVVEQLGTHSEVRRRGGTYGVRNLFSVLPEMRALASSFAVRALVEPILGGACFAVRATFFDKLPDANWKVGWHQDRMIAVRDHATRPALDLGRRSRACGRCSRRSK